MQLAIAGLLRVLSVCLTTSCLHSPLSWSPDGQWLAYNSLAAVATPDLPRWWLFDPKQANVPVQPAATVVTGPRQTYKIWVCGRSSTNHVLIDESRWPLSAPAWGPVDPRLAYLRFRPSDEHEGGTVLKGVIELVVQDALDRKQVAFTIPDVQLGEDDVDEFVESKPVWNPDGQSLLIARPGPEPAILIVRPGEARARKTLLGASLASWSPDGTRIATVVPVVDSTPEQHLQILGNEYAITRTINGYVDISEAPRWSADGQWVFFAGRRMLARSRNIEILRTHVESGVTVPALRVTTQPGPQASRIATGNRASESMAPSPHVSFSLNREQDQCVFATQIPGQEHVVVFSNIRQPQTYKRFPAIDIGLTVGSVSMHPDEAVIALRMDGTNGASPVLFCELGSEHITLLAPDNASRKVWLNVLERSTRELLTMALPRPVLNALPIERATVLPIAGEISRNHTLYSRIRRLAKVGQSLVHSSDRTASSEQTSTESDLPMESHRLFFDYLAGDYRAAESDIEAMETQADSDDLRLKLCAARAQVLHAQGELERAIPIIDYLLRNQRRERLSIEITPLGAMTSRVSDPSRDWLLYLSNRMAQPLERSSPEKVASDSEEDDEIDLRMPPIPGGFGNRPGQAAQGQRFFDALNGQGGDPLGPDRLRDAMLPPMPPRPFQPVVPLLPRFQRPAAPR